MLTITNNTKEVAKYVVREINGSSYIEHKAIELYKLNMKKDYESIIEVMQMVAEMYEDFIWTCGFSSDTTAKMDIELKQFILENIELLKL